MEAEILNLMGKNHEVIEYIILGLTLIHHRYCVSTVKSFEFSYKITCLSLKELCTNFILAGTMIEAGMKKILCQISMKGCGEPKGLGSRLIRIRSLFIEGQFMIEEFDLVYQSLVALPDLNMLM